MTQGIRGLYKGSELPLVAGQLSASSGKKPIGPVFGQFYSYPGPIRVV